MNKKIVVSTIIAAYLASMGAAFAQDHRQDERHEQRDEHHDQRDERAAERRNDRQDYRQVEDHGHDRGAGPRHDLRKGGRLPDEYRNRQYVVDDWRGHRLSAPPRGYHWVQTGGDYVLVAIATGIIANMLLNN